MKGAVIDTDGIDCSPSSILLGQLKKLSTFLYILIALFCAPILMTVFSQWQGISIIVNVYLYVFSFYLIFIFSSLDIRYLKEVYRGHYGRRGDLLLFLIVRVIPFVIIYFVTALFITIDYYGETFWPLRPIMELMDGRFSNIVFYSLILLVIVKLKKEPRITIPLFLLLSVLYFLIYKLVYTFSPTGLSISLLKYFQISFALFFIFNEFIAQRERIPKIFLLSLAMGAVLYFSLVGIFFSISCFSRINTYPQVKASLVLLKLGYAAPLDRLQVAVIAGRDSQLLSALIYYSERSGRPVRFSLEQWGTLFSSGTGAVNDQIASYLWKNNLCLPCGIVVDFAVRESVHDGNALLNAGNIISYTSKCCADDFNLIIDQLPKGNDQYRIWFTRVASRSKSIQPIPALIDMLTGVNEKLAGESYAALVGISGIDANGRYKGRYNDIELVALFSRYYRERSAGFSPRK